MDLLDREQNNGNCWRWLPFEDVVDILDNERSPINSSEREARILGKPISDLYPYYGATGQVGWIDGFLFDDERVLLGEDGAPFLENTKQKAYLVKGKCWVNNHAHVLKAKKGISVNQYILHYFNYFDYHGYVTGTTRYKLTQAQMKAIKIPLPSLPEQLRIVAKIEELFTQLDAAEAALKRARANLKRYRQSVLQAAVEGKFTNNLELTDEEIPRNWRWVTIRDVGVVKGGKRLPVGHTYSEEKTSFPYIRVVDFDQLSIDSTDLKYLRYETQIQIKQYSISKDDVYISIAGSIGKVGVVPDFLSGSNLTENAAKITQLQNINTKFLSFVLASPMAQRQIAESTISTNQPKLALFRIEKIKIPLPPVSEQIIIVAEVERRLTVAQTTEDILEVNQQRISSLRQSILQRAFSGQLIPQESNS